jgi:SAM-dependent methyltransferase
MIKDKIGFLSRVDKVDSVKLNLGCGNKREDGFVNVDVIDSQGVDMVVDLEKGLFFIPDNIVDYIKCDSFLEHIDNFDLLISDIFRVLKPGCFLDVFVPHFSNPYYYSDYTHKRLFGYYSFYYFSKDQSKIIRKVPCFYNDIDFKIVSQKFLFNSPFLIPRIIKKFFGLLINSSISFQEFYEAHLTNLCSCYGVEIKMLSKKS